MGKYEKIDASLPSSNHLPTERRTSQLTQHTVPELHSDPCLSFDDHNKQLEKKRKKEREREKRKKKKWKKNNAATSKTGDLDPETVPVVLVGWAKERDRGAESVEERE